MNAFMTNAERIMKDILEFIICEVLEEHRCLNIEVQTIMAKFENVLLVFDGVFSIARAPAGTIHEEDQMKA